MSSGTNPFINEFGKLRNIIVKMLATYKAKDPPIKRELLVTPAMLRLIKKLVKTTRDIFIVHLLIGVFFYAM